MVTFGSQRAWRALFTEGELGQFGDNTLHYDLPIDCFALQSLESLQETAIFSGPAIEGKDIDIAKEVIASEGVFHLHEQGADSLTFPQIKIGVLLFHGMQLGNLLI